jgi:hypothetical protein
MNILIVTPKPLRGPQHIEFEGIHYFMRCQKSGLKSLQIDIAFLDPGVTDDQDALARQLTWSCGGKVLKFANDELLSALLWTIQHPAYR